MPKNRNGAVKLIPPTPSLVEHYARPILSDHPPVDEDLAKYWHGERALRHYFSAKAGLPVLTHIYAKVVAVNAFYSTNIYGTWELAEKLHSHADLSRLIATGDFAAVECIRRLTKRDCYSFATKYCHHHQPEKYIIYDSYVSWLMHGYLAQYPDFSKSLGMRLYRHSNQCQTLRDYAVFYGAFEHFRHYFGLHALSLRQIDLFMWRYGKELKTK